MEKKKEIKENDRNREIKFPLNAKYVAVLGLTRSGKSTFINALSGAKLKTSDSLYSCTSDEEIVIMQDLVFISGPGFDDTNNTLLDTFKILTKAVMKKSNGQAVKFSSVLYFHSATNDRIGRSDQLSQSIFLKMVGSIPITTVLTKCDLLSNEVRKKRIMQLTNHFVEVFDGVVCEIGGVDIASYSPLMKVLNDSKISQNLLLQKELQEFHTLGKTSAFGVVEEELKIVMKEMKSAGLDSELEKLKADLKKAKAEKWTFADIAFGGFLAIPLLALGVVAIPVTILAVTLDGVVRLFTLNKAHLIDYTKL